MSAANKDEGELEDSDSGRLQIVTPEKNQDRKLKRKRRKKLSTSDEEDDPETEQPPINQGLEQKLQECAKRNNLTPEQMKQILKRLVGNDHALALVKLHEEAEKLNESEGKCLCKSDESKDETGKLTRSKARALNKKPIPISALIETQPKPEVAAFMAQDLHSDEEDEEYHPTEDDLVSDDDPNTTISDLDSQPNTPMTPASLIEPEEPPPAEYSMDGLFKIPRQRNDSSASYHEEVIANYTRSKLCLETTAIETLESNFVPPDIPTDMACDFDAEKDPDWLEFLNEFRNPLKNNVEEDDEADPEYVAADLEKIDSEELRDVNISKKELSDLVDELFNGLLNEGLWEDNIMETDPQKKPIDNKSPQKKKQRLSDDQNFNQASSSVDNLANTSQTSLNNSINFDPSVNSTPQSAYQTPESIFIAHNNNNTYPNETFYSFNYSPQQPQNVLSVNTNLPQSYLPNYQYYYNPYQPHSWPPPPAHPYHVVNVGQPYYPPNPSTDQNLLAKNSQAPHPTRESAEKTSKNTNNINIKVNTRKRFTPISLKNRLRQEYDLKYEALRNTPPVIYNFHENQIGFTPHQRSILDQQLRIHVQLTTQHFLQSYCHPEFWKHAERMRKLLRELNELTKDNNESALNPWNLKPALKLIQNWEDELSVDTPENTALVNFFYKEIDRMRENKRCRPNVKFPPRLLKLIAESPVFMYPSLLPHIPFGIDFNPTSYMIPAEDQLIALGMQSFYEKFKGQKEGKRYKKKKLAPFKYLYSYLSRNYLIDKKPYSIYYYIKTRRNEKTYNPIKYYDDNQIAPPCTHALIQIDFDYVKSPEEQKLEELPTIWRDFIQKVISGKHFDESDALLDYSNSLTVDASFDQEFEQNSNNSTPATNVTIHLNYVIENDFNNIQASATNSLRPTTTQELSGAHLSEETTFVAKQERRTSTTDYSFVCTRLHDNTFDFDGDSSYKLYKTGNNFAANSPLSGHGFSANSRESTPAFQFTERPNFSSKRTPPQEIPHFPVIPKGQRLLTEYFPVKVVDTPKGNKLYLKSKFRKVRQILRKVRGRYRKQKFLNRRLYLSSISKKRNREVKRKLQTLLISYRGHLYALCERYKSEYVRKVFVAFKTLEIYTSLLDDLKMNTKKLKAASANEEVANKKQKSNDEETVKTKKHNRTGDNLRHMLLPETHEDLDKKDAIYALNFYDKVDEIFNKTGKKDDFKKFQKILKGFNPQKDRVADLYYKMENLFLPDHPDLAEVFLTFLLPSDAAQIGKFFEHFILTNMGNFINKLNLYFNKQPMQIKKVYACLGELADDPDVTMEKIKLRILPLLKGNQFLIDWFLQSFPCERPPDSLMTDYETVNLKQLETQLSGETCEVITCEDLAPDGDQSSCQIKYINGRMFYGSKVLLPAKLSFLAEELAANHEAHANLSDEDSPLGISPTGCVHGIRDLGEKMLKIQCDSNEEDKCKDDEQVNATMPSYKVCDEVSHRAHAIRLNPSLYATGSATDHELSIPQKSKQSELDTKISPKKPVSRSGTSAASSHSSKERRRSPKKSLPKSPVARNSSAQMPSSESNAIQMAKKLKSVIEEDLDEGHKQKKKPSKSPPQAKSSQSETATDCEVKSEIIKMSPNSSNICDVKPGIWTRDEDKIILEEVKLGFENEHVLLNKLSPMLSHRTRNEIMERHQFLMDVLSQLQNRN